MGNDKGTSIVVAATILGLCVLGAAFMLGRSVDGATEQLALMQVAIARIQSNAAVAKTAAPVPRRRGPDPDKIYKVDLAGTPIRGPKSAKVTIAEFSDFQ